MTDDKTIRRLRREIERAPICTPEDGEYVECCHWSKTGWAIWTTHGGCSCRPALPPADRD